MGVPCVCFIGGSGSGKTTLLERLVPELRARGLRVLTLKHSGHPHPFHKAGSDTERLQAAGADAVGFATPAGLELIFPGDVELLLPELLERLSSRFDLVLVEGWKDSAFPKLEVWREGLGPCLAAQRSDVRALVTDDVPPLPLRRFRSDELPALASFVAWLAHGGQG